MGYKLTEKQTALLTKYTKGNAKPGERSGGFVVRGEDMVYEGYDQGHQVSELLATFIPNGLAKYPVMNAARLEYANTHVAWGNRQSPPVKECQVVLEKAGAIPIPFNVLKEAGIDPKTIHIVAKGASETIVRHRPGETKWDNKSSTYKTEPAHDSTEHFVGACVFEAKVNRDGVDETSHYLFDIDREEIKHKVFNPFIVKLPKAVTTIEEAYDSLIPAAVRQAMEEGKEIVRQGEWFFIPSQEPPTLDNTAVLQAVKAPRIMDYGLPISDTWSETPPTNTWNHIPCPGYECPYEVKDNPHLAEAITRYNTDRDAWMKAQAELTETEPHEGTLRAGNNRGNRVETTVMRNGVAYVQGTITHTGREHRDVTLTRWHIAVPNTAITSWQVTGEID